MTVAAPDQPAATEPVLAAVARVVGVDTAGIRRDTPLATIGWDSLARLCWEEAMAEAGWRCVVPATASTVGDLVDSCTPPGEAQ
jgi:hypothetical protein